MFIIDWWNSLSTLAQIFACIAVPATLVLIIQTVMMFIGFGDDADGVGDDPLDAVPSAGDNDGVFGDELPEDIADTAGLDGLRIFTIRGIIAFFVVFGWVGLVMDSSGANVWATIPVSIACGFAMMLILAFLFRAILKLRSDGNTDNRNAIGTAGKVQLTIPPLRSGEGKVHVILQGTYVERNAVTDETEAIPTGAEIIVVGVSGQMDLVVKRK